MKNDLYLITGATGATGGAAIEELLSKGARVRALVHRDDERASALRARGVEIAAGDLLDSHAVQAALQNVTGAYFVYPIMQPQLVDATAYFAHAAKLAGVRSIVNMSQISASADAQSRASLAHWYGERVFDWAGVPVTHLRPTLFMEWLSYGFQRAQIADHDLLRVPAGDGRHAPIAAADQGRVIARILLDREPHAGKTYPLFGVEELDHTQMAKRVGDALGRPVRYEAESLESFEARLMRIGLSAHFIQHITSVYRGYQAGEFAGTNDIVERVTGQKPMSVHDYVLANRQIFQPETQR
ncbi:NmrA family NAD(P)-binding protein [Paraburkholderia sp. SOS3]|jgi:NAD(P)H dehydrogenase (quinone)|uniref:NmrA family NAD(P)-binding protein n=1 Tax=Paraburkholderia sp. SOS3 TaxID=1926494 RepID=UPI0009477EC1|nr:NmrA family NAD(P)-binding protein [Paraburkholderia sp. SOS3]APR34857.1 NmrA family transcriptional regulator [Paraburkholderia sp. SOS3]